MTRRGFLHAAAAATLGASLPAGAADDEELLAQAKERIGRHRRGAGTVLVRGHDGTPVPGAQVEIEQERHAFLFGCNFFRFGTVGDPACEELYRERFAGLLNYATLGFYWAAYEPERGKPHYAYTDQAADWCGRHGIACKGHPLVWDYADPRWLPHDFSEIRELSHRRVREIVARFRGRIDRWDVVNEPTDLARFHTRLGEWAQSLGAVPYVREHLETAREANPQAMLLVNDYRTDPAYLQILRALKSGERPPFDAIGIQSHMHGGVWPLRHVWEVCDRFGPLGVPLHFTESTVVSGPRRGADAWSETTSAGEAAQAEYVTRFYTMLFAHPAVRAITWWDFSDDGAWMGAPAGWVRKDMSPKPAYDQLKALIRGEWWTRARGQTDARGEFTTSAFYGHYRITAILSNGRAVSGKALWEAGKPNRCELVV